MDAGGGDADGLDIAVEGGSIFAGAEAEVSGGEGEEVVGVGLDGLDAGDGGVVEGGGGEGGEPAIAIGAEDEGVPSVFGDAVGGLKDGAMVVFGVAVVEDDAEFAIDDFGPDAMFFAGGECEDGASFGGGAEGAFDGEVGPGGELGTVAIEVVV